MFLLAKLYPHFEHTETENYKGTFLSRKAKEQLVESFYKDKRKVPLCKDHENVGRYGLVKPENTIGRVCDLFIDKDGELIMKCELSKKHPTYKEVNHAMFTKRQKWGVSVFITHPLDEDGNVKSNNLIHVALTPNPAFGEYNTYITHWGLGEDDLNHAIVEKYGVSNLFLRGPLKEKLEGMKIIYFDSFLATLPFIRPVLMFYQVTKVELQRCYRRKKRR